MSGGIQLDYILECQNFYEDKSVIAACGSNNERENHSNFIIWDIQSQETIKI